MGINLHKIVRSSITAIHEDETVELYQSAGQINILGELLPAYFEPLFVPAQIQTEGGDKLTHSGGISPNETTRRFYLYSDDLRPAPVIRQKARGGDLIRRADGTWWLITATLEDFSGVGWVCVSAVLQIESGDWMPRLIETHNDEDVEGGDGSNGSDAADTGGDALPDNTE